MTSGDLVEKIRAANLSVYRASPTRLREDVSSEAEIAHDYQGRLIYELLQNADDAMAGAGQGGNDRIRFRLTDDALSVLNTGRGLTPQDVRGLTSTGASSKTVTADAGGRASIGHKGMGFKSVLEITDCPEIHSHDYRFVLDRERALPEVTALFDELGEPRPDRVPTMRFPWNLGHGSVEWEEGSREGFNVLFRFPWKPTLTAEKRANLASALLALPATTILFLKHLETVEIEIDTADCQQSIVWNVRRERRTSTGWTPVEGLVGSGIYQVWIESDDAEDIWCFMLAHRDRIEIGRHRGGLDSYSWAGITTTEVSVASLLTGGTGDDLPLEWRRFHVFLPTEQPSSYPLLVNGAFATDLSRKDVPVVDDSDDYNRFLVSSAGTVIVEDLLPAVLEHAGGIERALSLLERDRTVETARTTAAEVLHGAIQDALTSDALIPTESEALAAVPEVGVPMTFGMDDLGSDIRKLLPGEVEVAGRRIAIEPLCREPYAGILIDHGATALSATQTVSLLAAAPPEMTHLQPHGSGKIHTDPVLNLLQSIWENADKATREEVESAVRQLPLFPVAKDHDGRVDRIPVGDTETFFPPKGLRASIPLPGLRFMLQDVCWGSLTPRERTEQLRTQMPAWTALFQVRDFKFPDVMRVSILPALALDVAPEDRTALANWETLTAVCQLAGPTPSPDSPLPHGRLGSQRALFNLCRLPVPCLVAGSVEWVPAYRAYFSSEWIGAASVDVLTDALADSGANDSTALPALLPPEQFVAYLAQMQGVPPAVEYEAEASDSDEVTVDDDDEQAIESDAKDRWIAFLTWLGVNHVLRPIPFQDAEDRAKGWVSTKGLAQPSGHAFARLGSIWNDYSAQLNRSIEASEADEHDLYFYRLHDLENLDLLCELAKDDVDCRVAEALFSHLGLNWHRLERFAEVELAFLAQGTYPARRVDPPRADARELRRSGPDLWLFRLRRAAICPTAHGPRLASLTWSRSSELRRRFDRRGTTPDQFLPVLSEAASGAPLRSFSQAIGVREELTPSAFTLADAAAFVETMQTLYEPMTLDIPADVIRNQVNPAYQNLFELLSGSATKRGHADSDIARLHTSQLMVHDGRGHFRFEPASSVLYANRSGIREIQGIDSELWTFVLEGRPAVAAPLRELFGARTLDDALEWHPDRDDPALEGDALTQFRAGLTEIAPYLLARLRVERAEEDRAAEDANRMRAFIEAVEPVRSLSVSCEMDGQVLIQGRERPAFVRRSGPSPIALVTWGDNPWPPDSAEAESLATAITEWLDVSYLEPLLALLSADAGVRTRLLHLAGATAHLEGAREALRLEAAIDQVDPEMGGSGATMPTPTRGNSLDQPDPASAATAHMGAAAAARILLIDRDALELFGEPVVQHGVPSAIRSAERSVGVHEPASVGETRAYGGGTDLGALDALGMYLTMTFEHRRLLRLGREATVFDPSAPRATDAIFDVSTAEAIATAREVSERFRAAMATLQNLGLAVDAPGFDVLTLQSDQPRGLGRLIELKSSGVNSRSLDMTWNEWKTAGHPELRERFYLYLVGNLRADLESKPFIRAIQDPFGELQSAEREDRSARRAVRLDVAAFREAEFQEFTVRRPSE